LVILLVERLEFILISLVISSKPAFVQQKSIENVMIGWLY